MSETLKKIGLFGIGIIVLTQERLEEFTQEMIKKGEMNREEGKKFVIEVLLEKDRILKYIEENVNKKIKDVMEHSGFATKKDIQNLEKRIDTVERDITLKLQ